VIEHAPDSQAAEDYVSLAEWLMEHARIERSDEPETAELELPELPDLPDTPLGSRWKRERSQDDTPPPEPVRFPRLAAIENSNGSETASASQTGVVSRADELRQRVESMRRSQDSELKPVAQSDPADFETRRATQRRAAMERLFGARVGSDHVLFVQPIELGDQISISGSFNDWSTTSLPMRRNDALGVHELSLHLPAGRHRYQIVVDGRAVADRYNTDSGFEENGDAISVIEVTQHQVD
ncbi:MAG: hypothetical protein AAGI17_10535, partial [Planctomycetota bacterium]